MTTWKNVERQIAKLLGGERIPVSGRQRGYAADISHNVFSIEVKHRQELPGWILDGLSQAQSSSRESKIPLLLLHRKGMRYDESLAVLQLQDLIKMQKRIEELEAINENCKNT